MVIFARSASAAEVTIQHDADLDKVATQHLQQILKALDTANIDTVSHLLREHGLADAQILPFASVGKTRESVEEAFRIFRDKTAKKRAMTHFGLATYDDPQNSRVIRVAIFSRRLVSAYKLPGTVSKKAVTIALFPSVPHKIRDAAIEGFFETPKGKILRLGIERNWLSGQAEMRLPFTDGPGRYVFEIMVNHDRGPEASLLWTFNHGGVKTFAAKAPESLLLPDDKSTLLALTLRARIKAGVKPLLQEPRLADAANEYAETICQTMIAAHLTPNGQSASDRAQEHGYTGPLAENVAIAQTVSRAHQNILNSPSHKYNLISDKFTHIGVGVASRKAQAKSSTFDKRPNRTWCVVQLFGVVR